MSFVLFLTSFWRVEGPIFVGFLLNPTQEASKAFFWWILVLNEWGSSFVKKKFSLMQFGLLVIFLSFGHTFAWFCNSFYDIQKLPWRLFWHNSYHILVVCRIVFVWFDQTVSESLIFLLVLSHFCIYSVVNVWHRLCEQM